MKKVLLLILVSMICNVVSAQLSKNRYPRDDNGNYTFEYIHNFYNRTEDVVYKVAREFLIKQPDLYDTLHNDIVNKKVSGLYKWSYKGVKGDCVSSADVFVTISIYYKDNRTKIAFSDFKYDKAETGCNPKGKVEDLDTCNSCIHSNFLIQALRNKCSGIGDLEYKKYLEKRARDPKLF